MMFTFTDADGNVHQIEKDGRITKEDVANYTEFVNGIIHARQEDVVVKEAYTAMADGEDECEEL